MKRLGELTSEQQMLIEEALQEQCHGDCCLNDSNLHPNTSLEKGIKVQILDENDEHAGNAWLTRQELEELGINP